jgi:3-oxoacyl-[acyl-carrier-protein] synthase I
LPSIPLVTLTPPIRTHTPAVRRQMRPTPAPVATTFAGFNGESFDAKMWGVAYLRHKDLFAPAMGIEHPADKFGDAGAAMGAILVALAAESLGRGTRRGPALVWERYRCQIPFWSACPPVGG